MQLHQRNVMSIGISALLLLASGAAHAGVIAHWTLDGTPGTVPSGVGSVTDVSGNNLHGTPDSRGTPTYAAAGGLRFDGSGSRDGVFLADSSLFASASLTVEAFVSLDSLPASGLRQIVFRGDSRAGFDPFYLGVLGNSIRWYVQGGPTTSHAVVDVPIPFALEEQFHVAGTIDDATGLMNLYFNGTLVGSRTTTQRPTLPVDPGAQVSIGYLDDGGFFPGQYLDGVIDELRISDIALAPGEFLNAVAVPEPSTILLGLLGLPMVLGRRRRAGAEPGR